MTAVSLLKDIKTTFTGGSYDSYPRWLTPFDEKIFFSAGKRSPCGNVEGITPWFSEKT